MSPTTGVPEQQPKWIGQSKTFWGIAMAFIPQVFTMLGVDWWSVEIGQQVSQIGNTVISLAGSAWALYGRFKAQGPATIGAPK